MESVANTMSNHPSTSSATGTDIAVLDKMAKIQFIVPPSQREDMPPLLQTALTTHFDVPIELIDKFARCEVCSPRRIVTWFGGGGCRGIAQAIGQLKPSIMWGNNHTLMLQKLIIFARLELDIPLAQDEVATNVMCSKRKTRAYDIEFYGYNDDRWDAIYDDFADPETNRKATTLIVKIKNQLRTWLK